MIDWQSQFQQSLAYDAFLEQHGSATDRTRWTDVFSQYAPTGQQRSVIEAFVRDMNVLCLAGAWCGDCVQQCPLLQHFARLTPRIHLRFMDRDADPTIAEELRVCGGARVPVVVFLSEDFAECGRYGDRTLTQYRHMASEHLSAGQPAEARGGIATPHDIADDWLREFERIQLMLQLSPRLRKRHGD